MNKTFTTSKKAATAGPVTTTSKNQFHTRFRRFSVISLLLFSYLTFKTFPASAQRPQILARNRVKTKNE